MATIHAEKRPDDGPTVYLSYAQQDRQVAERLRRSLERLGCTVTDPMRFEPGQSFVSQMEAAVRSSDRVVLLVGKHRRRDPLQESEWQAAVEAKWEDADKRMIPVLLGDAEVPSFVRGTAVYGDFGLHLSGLKEIERAAEVIARGAGRAHRTRKSPMKRHKGNRSTRRSPGGGTSGGAKSDKDAPRPKDVLLSSEIELEFPIEPVEAEERRERFAAIERFAQELAEEREAS